MSLLLFLVLSGIILVLAYRLMGRFLARFLGLDANAAVPAHTKRDGLDFEPAKASYLLPQHFSAIAAAGPIVGPILAGIYFGWGPAWLWIILGAIFIGGIHDITTLIASVRHEGRSIAEVVRRYMNPRSYRLFLAFIWVSLIYVIVAFADVTAETFTAAGSAVAAEAPGPGVASSSAMYLLVAIAMGLTLRYTKLRESRAQWFFLPAVLLAIACGPLIPIDITSLANSLNLRPQLVWDYALLIYCFLAALAPVWLLLQPRGALGGYFLYAVIIFGVLGIVVGSLNGSLAIQAPVLGSGNFFSASTTATGAAVPPMFPVLFITIACGACSGFHSIVASGTTSKQLNRETDAKPVAYGGMLLEAFFACISLATVMILAKPTGRPDLTYANGLATFINQATFGFIPQTIGLQFGLLCFATFVFDTLDACTRLARYVLMELTGWKNRSGMIGATLITLAIPALLLSLPPAQVAGAHQPLWRVFWSLFGISNQLLAALALLAVTVWFSHRGKSPWLTLAPMFFMLTMTLWSLGFTIQKGLNFLRVGNPTALQNAELFVALLLTGMTLWLVIEALLLSRRPRIYRQAA